MIKIDSIAELLQNELNSLGSSCEFKIVSNNAKFSEVFATAKREDGKVYGILAAVPGATIVPIQGLNNYSAAYSLEMIVNVLALQNAYASVSKLIENYVGTSLVIDDYAAVIGFDFPSVGEVEIKPQLGQCQPISLTAYFQFIKNGMLSNNVKLSVNGEDLKAIEVTLLRARPAETTTIPNEAEMGSVVGQQGLIINATIPYTTDTLTVKEIANDILKGQIVKSYDVRYNDEVMDCEWTMLLTDASLNMSAQKVASIAVSLQVARKDTYKGGGSDE